MVDSSLHVINKMKDDTNKILALKKLGNLLEETDTSSAFKLYQQGLSLSRKVNSKVYEAKMLINIGNWYSNSGRYNTAKNIYRNALTVAQQTHINVLIASAYVDMGNMCNNLDENDSAITLYMQGAKLLEKLNDTIKLDMVYGNLASLFDNLHLYTQELVYSKKALYYAMLAHDNAGLCEAYNNAANAISQDSITNNTVKNYRFLALYYGKKSGIQRNIQAAYSNIASYYLIAEKYSIAKLYSDSSLLLSRKLGAAPAIGFALVLDGVIDLKMKNYTEAEKQFNQSIPFSKAFHSWQPLREAYNDLAEINEHHKKWQQAYYDMKQYAAYKDSAFNEDVANKLQEVEAKYNDEKKEQQINSLQKNQQIQQLSIRQKSTLNYALFGGLVALIIISSLFYRNHIRKQQLSQKNDQLQTQRIKELEQEKQLIATNALLTGQEEERTRVARDLHDGLGGMLSGIKLTLHAMKGNVILSADNARLFSKSIEQLDNSISEMRRVAHNMMPEALVKFGLAQALQDYCDSINETQQISCILQLYGLETRLETTTEIVIYRIVQELLNNVVKHAQATQVIVQVIKNQDKINVTVEDNGKGFKTEQAVVNKGAGFNNVRSRVNYLRGIIELQSDIGKGTSVHIYNLVNNSN